MTAEQLNITYRINNILATPPEYQTWNSLEYPNAKELAEAKLIEVRNEFLAREQNRFHVAKVTTLENGEIWSDADIDNDPENGDYRVLNHNSGLYDSFSTLTEVKANVEIKKAAFVHSVGLDKVTEIDMAQPTSSGLQQA